MKVSNAKRTASEAQNNATLRRPPRASFPSGMLKLCLNPGGFPRFLTHGHRTRGGESARKYGSPSVAPPVVKIGSPMTEDRHALPNRLEHFARDFRDY